jgi:peptidoglycan/LPS O-acetylase OafA/YrhL
LRGIAALLVAVYHFWTMSWFDTPGPAAPLVQTGFLGVEIFFCISGFVLALPYVQAHLAGEPLPSTWRFAVSRALKILPSYWLCIVVLLALGWDAMFDACDRTRAVVTHLLFVQVWWRDTTPAINGVLWTLAVEVQFYVLFPLLVRAFLRQPVLTAGIMVLIGNGFRLWTAQNSAGTPYYWLRLDQLPASIDLFAAGMVAALVYASIRRPNRALCSLAMIAGIAAFYWLAQSCVTAGGADWPYAWKAQWRSGIGAAFILAVVGALCAYRPLQALFANRALLFLGAISYNLYLWNLPIAKVLRPMIHAASANPIDDPAWRIAFPLVALIASILVASAVTYWLERPILRWGRRWNQPRKLSPE